MRLCRYLAGSHEGEAFYFDTKIVPWLSGAAAFAEATGKALSVNAGGDLLSLLPPDGPGHAAASAVYAWLSEDSQGLRGLGIDTESVTLLAPIPKPPKILLLAGNYAAHIEEGGGIAVEREQTFPYVFMKPVTTTLSHTGAPFTLPAVSPEHIDWEAELGVIIGKRAKGVSEAEALEYVAGYTVVNDISDRRFKPNPGRTKRAKDDFFDWLHGKWHDGSCPMGPCVIAADAVPDPQNLHITLKVNGVTKQDASTALQIYPVAAVIAFISSWVTLEPGDVISTGTPSGVGNARGEYLRAGDVVEAAIDGIGVLRNWIVAE